MSVSRILHCAKGCCDAKRGADTERREQLVSTLAGLTVRTKGVTMDSTFLMFAVVMFGILVGGIVVYKKSQ